MVHLCFHVLGKYIADELCLIHGDSIDTFLWRPIFYNRDIGLIFQDLLHLVEQLLKSHLRNNFQELRPG